MESDRRERLVQELAEKASEAAGKLKEVICVMMEIVEYDVNSYGGEVFHHPLYPTIRWAGNVATALERFSSRARKAEEVVRK
ncbi:MAG: hypothetical protein DRJ18_00620 [Candidatus Methanomethylicota archaeon]|nr:MAG: hypothetical protein DRJ18_00620 [Candidatus Verstraetearchaeota archaeon]